MSESNLILLNIQKELEGLNFLTEKAKKDLFKAIENKEEERQKKFLHFLEVGRNVKLFLKKRGEYSLQMFESFFDNLRIYLDKQYKESLSDIKSLSDEKESNQADELINRLNDA